MMRLRAIRLREVGCFDTATALEGLGDGLNVLCGRNELGKSTLLQALRIAFEKKHTSGDGLLEDLKPYTGGAPLIEVDFETPQGRWRLRKQYLQNKSAELTNLTTGISVRNNDVQDQLDALLRRTSRDFDRFQMLWIEQGAQPDFAPKSDRDRQDDRARVDGLAGLMADELETLSIDRPAQAVRDQVRKLLGGLQTDTRKPKKGGRWQLAVEAVEKHATAAAQIADRSNRHAERLAQLTNLVDQRAVLENEDGIGALISRRATAAHRHEQALQAQRAAEAAKKILQTRMAEMKLAEQAMLANVKADDDIAALQQQISSGETELAERITSLATHATDTQRAAMALAELQARVDTLAAALTDARRIETAIATNAERTRLQTAIAAARSAIADRDHALTRLAAVAHVTSSGVADLEDAAKQLARWDARFESIAPEVSIVLDPAARGLISVDGQTIAADALFNPDRPLEIVIAGIGRIRVAPHPATASAEAIAERSATRSRVQTLLAELRVGSPAEAKAALAERAEADHGVQAAGVRLSLLAPNGIEAVTTALANCGPNLGGITPPQRGSTALEQDLIQARLDLAQAETALRHKTQASSAQQQSCAILQATQNERIGRLADLNAVRPPEAARTEAAAAFAATKQVFTDAHYALDTLLESAATFDPVAAASSLRDADSALTAAQDAHSKLQLDIKGLESALEVESNEDLAGELSRSASTLEHAQSVLSDVEEERAALQLLTDEFEAIADAGREQISAPVRARIRPYLDRVLPGATLELDASFAPRGLARGAAVEHLHRLSQGTREQIAIITRLGLGKLLADKQSAVPLILDDALVYTDDDRIEAMFEALAVAAADHQVLVFTCRTQSFTALLELPSTTTLQLRPWDPGVTATAQIRASAA